jgi:hypothetical protein
MSVLVKSVTEAPWVLWQKQRGCRGGGAGPLSGPYYSRITAHRDGFPSEHPDIYPGWTRNHLHNAGINRQSIYTFQPADTVPTLVECDEKAVASIAPFLIGTALFPLTSPEIPF